MATKFQEEVDKMLECAICLEEIKQPKMLQCPHSFCLDPCLKNLANAQGKKFSLVCPVCRKTSSVEDLNDLPDNYHLKSLIEIRQKQPKPDEIITKSGS